MLTERSRLLIYVITVFESFW